MRRSADGRHSPHPLFDAAHVAAQVDLPVGSAPGSPAPGRASTPLELFLLLLEDELPRDVSPHPLLDASLYAADHPAALEHPCGVFGHYVDVGAAAGHRPSSWFDPGTDGDLVSWLRESGRAWASRQALRPPMDREPPPRPDALPVPPAPTAGPEGPSSTVVVVVERGAAPEQVVASLRSVGEQSDRDFALVVVHHHPLDDDVLVEAQGAAGTGGHRLLSSGVPGAARLRNLGLALASTPVVAWLRAGDRWGPEHLATCRTALLAGAAHAAHDVTEVHLGEEPKEPTDPPTRSTRYTAGLLTAEALAHGAGAPLSSVVVRRPAAVAVQGFDEALPAAMDEDFLLRVAGGTGVQQVPVVGTYTWSPPPPRGRFRGRTQEASLRDEAALSTWGDVVLNRHVVDWDALATRPRARGSVSVIIPTHDDAVLTARAVDRVVETTQGGAHDVEVLVVDNGTPLAVALQISALPLRHRSGDVRVLALPVNHGFALGNNLGVAQARGEVVVLLNNDTEVLDGWLEPLLDALEDPQVLGSQSLLLYPSGSIQSAGVAFPTCGGVPHAFLQGFPVEDGVRALPGARLSALTAAAMAVRAVDLARVEGLDPLFRNGMEDVDLGLRLRERADGHFVVRPDSRVVHHESRASGRYVRSLQNRRVYLERWGERAPRDDRELWGRAGFEVVGHGVVARMAADPRTSLPEPRLVRRVAVREPAPRLRWALKNPAPATAEAELWGDTHFVRPLAAALGRLGQEVVVDHRPELNRPTGTHDDVVVVIRGVASEYLPVPGQVNVLWLISHPDMLGRSEAEQYDVLLAASTTWARATAARWDVRAEPLLQACDPGAFHPDVAVPDTGHPVLFVGNSRLQRRPLVAMAADAGLPLSVYGPGWEGLLPSRFVKAEHLRNADLPAAYRSAGVVLNDHWEDMRTAGFVSNRLFEAAAAGARVVTDDVVDLPPEFGRSVQVVRDETELREMLRRDPDTVFGDDDERRAVARAVGEAHSFDARAARLLELAVPRWRQVHGGADHAGDDVRRRTA